MHWHSPVAVLALPGVLSRAQQEPPPLPWSCRDLGPTGGSTHPGDKLGALPGALLSSRSTAGVCLRLGDGTGQPRSTQQRPAPRHDPRGQGCFVAGGSRTKIPLFLAFPFTLCLQLCMEVAYDYNKSPKPLLRKNLLSLPIPADYRNSNNRGSKERDNFLH